MDIDYKGPKGFILDISTLLDVVDGEQAISPLAWQYVIEQDLINKAGLNVVERMSLIPSLVKQISLVSFLQAEFKYSVINCVPGQLILHLRPFEIEVKINGCALFLLARTA